MPSILSAPKLTENERREPDTENLLALIDLALRSPRGVPGFPPELEERFEADTGARRIRHIRRTLLLSLVLFHLCHLIGFITASNVAPPLLVATFLLTVTILAIAFYWVVDRVRARTREALCGLAILTAASIPLLVFGLGPDLLLSTAAIWLSVIFANILSALRFGWACAVSCVVASVGYLAIGLHPDVDGSLVGVLRLDMLVGITLSLLAAHRIETANRRSYLLILRETLRLRQLAADNTMLARLSNTDPLTGLANRRAFTHRITALWRDAQQGTPFALLLIDVDHFKSFNDHYGHGAGDTCLCEIARLLRTRAGAAGDLVVRYGGEEFALLLPRRDKAEAVVLAERVRQALDARALPHANRGDGIAHVTVSVGVAVSPDDATTTTSLMEAADAALYRAKAAGRNQIGLPGGTSGRSDGRRVSFPASPLASWAPRDRAERRLRA